MPHAGPRDSFHPGTCYTCTCTCVHNCVRVLQVQYTCTCTCTCIQCMQDELYACAITCLSVRVGPILPLCIYFFRFSPFVKTGSEAFVLGRVVATKSQPSPSDTLRIIVSGICNTIITPSLQLCSHSFTRSN